MTTATEPKHIKSVFDGIRSQIDFTNTRSRTKSEFKNEVNINTIVRRAQVSGVMPSGNRQPLYGDFSNSEDYTQAQIRIAQANEEFLRLPSDIREKFANNVSNLLEFIQDPENHEQAVELGLIPAPEVKVEEAPQAAENVTETATETSAESS